MTETNNDSSQANGGLDWRARSYLIWVSAGTFFGTLAGYLYNRAAREHAERNGDKPPRPGTLELVGLILAAMAMIRQITELGRPDED